MEPNFGSLVLIAGIKYHGELSVSAAPTTASREHTLRETTISVNGAPFRLLEQGQGRAVLFAHGFPDIADTWRAQMAAVANAGFRAIAIDMRGFGQSYAPDSYDLYASPYIVGDLVGVLDSLNIRSAALVGHDWGADHAQRAMLMRPDRFRALISLSIPYAPRGDASLNEDLHSRGLGDRYYALGFEKPGTGKEFLPAEDSIPRILYWLSASPEPQARWDPIDPNKHMLRAAPVAVPEWADSDYLARAIAAFDRTGFETGLNYYRAIQKSFELMAAYKNAVIGQPSLYIWGAADGLCQFFHSDRPTVDDFRANQPGLVGVIRIQNAGHWLQHEAASEVNAAIIDFLREYATWES